MELLNDDEQTDFSEKQAYDRLMDGKDIRYKTEITPDQRCIIPSIETSIKHFGKKGVVLHVAANYVLSFIDMGASINRQSRKETVEALKAKLDFLEKNQLMDKQSNIIR